MGSTPASYGTLTIETSLDPLSSSVSSVVRRQGRGRDPPGGTNTPAYPHPHFLLQPPPRPHLSRLSPASTEAQRLLWQSMEGYRLSRRGLDDGRDPFAALPVEAGVGGAAAAPAVQPGPRRNTRHRNKRQRGKRPSRAACSWRGEAVGQGWEWRLLGFSAHFLWDLMWVVLSGPQLSHLSCGWKGQVRWLLRGLPMSLIPASSSRATWLWGGVLEGRGVFQN